MKNATPSIMIHWDAVAWVAIGIIVMGLPTGGLLLAESTLWNSIWWVVLIAWMLFFMTRANVVNMFMFWVFSACYFEFAPPGRLWAYLAGFLALICLMGAYRERCRALGHSVPTDAGDHQE